MITIPDGGLECTPLFTPHPAPGPAAATADQARRAPRSGLPSPFLPIHQLLRRR